MQTSPMDSNIMNIFSEILQKCDNQRCADCDNEHITHVNCYFQITLCDMCTFAHSLLSESMHSIRPITKDKWQGLGDITLLKSINNKASNRRLLQVVPIHYSPLLFDSPCVWRIYFIKAKYIAKKYTLSYKIPLKNDTGELIKEGVLWKRGSSEDKYRQRYFVLQENGWLAYYKDTQNVSNPDCIIPIERLDIYFAADKMGILNGLQLSFPCNKSIRDIYLYSDESDETIEWYNAIRAAKLEILKRDYPGTKEKTLAKLISGTIIKEGYLRKSGSWYGNSSKRRWFTLTEKPLFLYTQWVLRYYEHPLDSHPKGEIYIGKHSDGYEIDLKKSSMGRKQLNNAFTLATSSASFDFTADTPEERESWCESLNIAFSRES